jgi:uncharacterized membrane protein
MTDEQPAKRPAPIRLLSLEGLFGAFGLFSLATGLWQGELMPVFWGVVILAGLAVLTAVRRRDWQKHWDDVEKQRDRHA